MKERSSELYLEDIIHAYFGVDMDILWETAKNMLPELKCILEKISKK